ncbi:hypothetical protein [Nonomuraea longicatena]|uniref:Uncharacterized protein n=1 Tax=Nonomuraea longicatena TaxID=83682 RepID=A0ABN1Q4T4_9ACTN
MRKTIMRTLFACVLAPVAVVGAATSAASAQAPPRYEDFTVCYKPSDCNMGFVKGTITWPFETVYEPVKLEGAVVNRRGSDYSTTVVVEAFYGNKLKRSATRTAKDGRKGFTPILFGQNPSELIDRIKITVCQNFPTGRQCGRPGSF